VRAVDVAGRVSAWINSAASGRNFVVDVSPPTTPRVANVAQTIVDIPDTGDCGTDGVFPLSLAVTSTDANFAGQKIQAIKLYGEAMNTGLVEDPRGWR
jgi:hypothetical protein